MVELNDEETVYFTTEQGEQLRASLVGAALGVVSIVGARTVGKVIDKAWEGRVDKNKLYDDYINILERSSQRMGGAPVQVVEYDSVTREDAQAASETESIGDDAGVVKSAIRGAIENLEIAQQTTNCGYCKKSLADTIETVKGNTEYIISATDKWSAMQTLKKAGKIPLKAKWSDLSVQEKNLVDSVVDGMSKINKTVLGA